MKKESVVLNVALSIILVASITAAGVMYARSQQPEADINPHEGVATDTVRFAIQPSAAFIPLYVAREEGWLEEALAEYGVGVEWNSFDAGPAVNESMLKDESDIGVLGDVPTVFAIGLGQENVIIATAAQAADSYAVIVRTDSDIYTAEDLRGRRLATVIGTTAHNLTDKYLATGGLTLSDISFVNITAADAATVLADGRADAVAIWEPSVTRITDSGVARILGEGSDCGLAGTNTLVARRDFVEGNPELVTVINEQYRRAAQALADGTVDDETMEAVAAYLKLDSEQVVSLLPKFYYTVDIADEDIEALNDTIAFLYKVDQLPNTFDIADYVYVSE